ncbi:TPA: RHS repeat domain-containing protein [Pseudomonas aeruginosa]
MLSYDDLNRLLRSARTLDGTQVVQDFTYDALGNLTGKSGVGAYRYGSYSSAEQQLCAGRGGVAQPGPHAVRGTSAGTYCYDARGNQLSGPGRQVKYASFDKPVEISAGSSLSRFSYDPERKRYLQTVDGRTSVYLDEGRFEEVNDGGRSWQDAYIGDYLILRKEGGAVKKLYLLRDALGSVEILLDANGAVSERQSFAAFGEHRGADWKDNGNQPTATSTRRGFTGHEHLEESGLVHMNGRVYDPVIGRFLSSDSVYDAMPNVTSWNRYSYAAGNPFGYVDFSGFSLIELKDYGPGGLTDYFVRDLQKLSLLNTAIDVARAASGRGAAVFSGGAVTLSGSIDGAAQQINVDAGRILQGGSRLLRGALLAVYPNGFGEGYWEFPGGHVDGDGYFTVSATEEDVYRSLQSAVAVLVSSQGRQLYGPFHRRESPTQTVNVSIMQTVSQEIWGRPAQGSSEASVQAYKGSLPDVHVGIEFLTFTPPRESGHPTFVDWRLGQPGVFLRGDYAAISVILYKNTQVYRRN